MSATAITEVKISPDTEQHDEVPQEQVPQDLNNELLQQQQQAQQHQTQQQHQPSHQEQPEEMQQAETLVRSEHVVHHEQQMHTEQQEEELHQQQTTLPPQAQGSIFDNSIMIFDLENKMHGNKT